MIVVTPTPLDGVVVVEPTVFDDDRGFFMESFNSHVEDFTDNNSSQLSLPVGVLIMKTAQHTPG